MGQNNARGVRFLLDFNMCLFLAQCEQVYLFLVLAQFRIMYNKIFWREGIWQQGLLTARDVTIKRIVKENTSTLTIVLIAVSSNGDNR